MCNCNSLIANIRTGLALPTLLLVVFAALPWPAAIAQTGESETSNAKFQATYVWQAKPAMSSLYSGTNSLTPQREKSYSFTTTAALGVRPWAGGEAYFNPEVAQGVPLSNLTGLGGFTNGEMARTSGPNPTVYRARLFLRQTWNTGGNPEKIESDFNQLAGTVDKRRWVLTTGNLSVTDIFDDNAYSHDPRTQFLNWSIMTHGAYDFAADSRGYSWGIALERYYDDWVIRAGRFLQPRQPNQLKLDPGLFRAYGDQIEFERAHAIAGQSGKVRVLAFRNRSKMARYEDALALGARTATTPDITIERNTSQVKSGVGVNLEQAVTADTGLFLRMSWADGKTEAYAYTEIDNSLSGGALIKGTAWQRGKDTVGIAFASNGLSKQHRDYLQAGGLGFFIGDGRLRYKRETIFETFYSVSLTKALSISLDYQRIQNPAYNAHRGPANFYAMRLHAEY